MSRERGPRVMKTCAWCQKTFFVPPNKEAQRCCSKSCHGHWTAVKRGEAAFRAMGKAGGTGSGQRRRRNAVANFLTCVQGPMRAFGTSLYLLGFMHGQNTAIGRLRKQRPRG